MDPHSPSPSLCGRLQTPISRCRSLFVKEREAEASLVRALDSWSDNRCSTEWLVVTILQSIHFCSGWRVSPVRVSEWRLKRT